MKRSRMPSRTKVPMAVDQRKNASGAAATLVVNRAP